MDDLMSYELRDFLMFAPSTYFRMIELYNDTLSVAVLLPSLLIVFTLYLYQRQTILWPFWAVLGGLWLFVGWQFFLLRFQEIMWAGVYMAAAFFIQGLALLWFSQLEALSKESKPERNSRCASILILVSLAYPIFSAVQRWEAVEFAGIMPDPTVLLTMVALTVFKGPKWLTVIPVWWVLFSTLMLYAMEQPYYWLLPVSVFAMVVSGNWLSRGKRA